MTMPQFRRLWQWWCGLSGTDRATIVLEFVGIVVVALYTTIAAFQWDTMRKQLKMSERAWIELDNKIALTRQPDLDSKAGRLMELSLWI
jgi:hypothetical protein